jgi:ArsR family transcriptional regulator
MSNPNPTPHLRAFKALANDARFRILQTIVADGREHTCQELIATLGMTPPAASNHLRILQEADLITTQRRGTQIYVSLAASNLAYQMAAVVRSEPPSP